MRFFLSKLHLCLCVCVLMFSLSAQAQTIFISELVADNDNSLLDEDGDSPDWIELYNSSNSSVDITGWHLTDDASDLTQWTFPTTTIPAESFLIVFASDKNRAVSGQELHTNFKLSASGDYIALVQANGTTIEDDHTLGAQEEDISYGYTFPGGSATVLLDAGANCTAHIPTSSSDAIGWKALSFSDSGWLSGTTGVGYENSSGYESLIGLDVTAMFNTNSTVYIRVPFTASNTATITSLILKMKYDDGFVAYINDTRVSDSGNAPDPLEWDSVATANHNDGQAVIFQEFDLSTRISALQDGNNILAIHGLNRPADSSDILLVPRLEASFATVINNSEVGILDSPTPGSANTGLGYAGFVDDDITASPARGFYDTSFSVTLTNPTAGAEIRYTTDGSEPTTSSALYTSPILVSTTTTLRSKAFRTDWKPSLSRTDTYIFADDVANQPKTTPSAINGQVLEYGMDAGVLAKTYYDASNQLVTVEDSLKAIPSISLTTDHDNLYDSTTGIYVNATQRWEVPASAELIYPDGTEGFQINAGLRIRGGASRSATNSKHSFRLVFSKDYGASKLKYALFEDEGVDEFDKIDFRSAQNYSWSKDNNSQNTFLRDVFARDSAGAMGQDYTRSRYYHLYLNGEYWGLFMTEERPVAGFGASYHGGDKDDYDALKVDITNANKIEATDGNTDAYERLYDAMIVGFSDTEDYLAIQGLDANGNPDPTKETLLDVDNMIDYLLVIYYMAASDNCITWFAGRFEKLNNMYVIYNRANPDGFKWIQHDSEHSLDTRKQDDMTGPFPHANFLLPEYFNAMTLHEKLSANDEYKIKFADRVYKHLENGGVMTRTYSEARLDYRAAQIDRAIVANAARWGSTTLDRDTWVNAVATTRAWLGNSGDRCDTVVSYLDADGLIPSAKPPQLSQSGGLVAEGTTISLSEFQSTSTPFGASPHAIPGIIGAADFDNGGQGVAYYDSDSGNNDSNNTYRPSEDVDIQDSNIGGYHIGWFETGEWLRYTVDVASTGDYAINVKLARAGNNVAAFGYHIEVDGIDVTGSVAVDGTGGWENWVDYTSSVGLAAGEQVITLVIEAGGLNVRSIEFVDLGTNNLPIATSQNTIYYTVDGTDPRAIGGAITGTVYSTPISITRPTHLKARARSSSGEWSALAEETYWTPEIPLAVTELMYHAPDGNAHDFIEIQNISDQTVSLKGYKLDNAVDFKFKNAAQSALAPDEYLVVIDDIDAFNASYPSSTANIAGEFGGDFSSGGEKVDLEFRNNDLITFSYDDARNWPQAADGGGHSLVPLVSAMEDQEAGSLDYGGNWRASSYIGGSPGEADPELPITMVINEIWAHTDTNLPAPNDSNDKIELYNTSNALVTMSGWYLSDSISNPQKWPIPTTMLSAGAFVVFDETDFHASEINGFGLNKAGEQVVLSSPNGIVDVVRFKGLENSATGVTWGRYPDGEGNWMMTAPTHASSNQPATSTVRISEVMYHPTQSGNDYEYIQIKNVGTTPHTFENAIGPYRIDGGVDFTFPTSTTLATGERLWILSFDPIDTARLNLFAAAYGLTVGNETFLGGYSGSLSDRAERVAIERPQDSDDPLKPLDISWVVIDEVFYFDQSPWPSGADGTGYPLLRTGLTTWGAPSATDSDADKIKDSWEMLYFSSLIDPEADPDADGQTNLDEFIGGTIPNDTSSYFKIQNATPPHLSWNSISDRTYNIYRTTGLHLPFVKIATTSGSPFTDSTTSPEEPSYFYKITADLNDQ